MHAHKDANMQAFFLARKHTRRHVRARAHKHVRSTHGARSHTRAHTRTCTCLHEAIDCAVLCRGLPLQRRPDEVTATPWNKSCSMLAACHAKLQQRSNEPDDFQQVAVDSAEGVAAVGIQLATLLLVPCLQTCILIVHFRMSLRPVVLPRLSAFKQAARSVRISRVWLEYACRYKCHAQEST